MYCVYILHSKKSDRYYIGSTANLDDRLKRHNSGQSKSTRPFLPYALVYKEEFNSFSAARKRESEIKRRKSRKYIESLIK